MSLKPLPAEFETALFAHLKSAYVKVKSQNSNWNQKDINYFAKGIVKLNEAYTTVKTSRNLNYFNDPVMRSGYLAYFLPVNAMKAMSIFDKIPNAISKTQLRILDVGAGPLTMLFGFLFSLQDQISKIKSQIEIEVHAVEQNEKILKDGQALLEKYLQLSGLSKKIHVKIVRLVANAFSFRTNAKNFDFILIGNFLNEIPERARQTEYILHLLERYSAPHTHLVMLEPASKKISRDLQALRDDILEATPYRVLAPCLHQNSCPLNLTAKGDWCNFTQQWRTPAFIQAFDKLTTLKKTYLMYSYLILANDTEPKHAVSEFIAISNTMTATGRLELVGCGPAGRIRFVRSNANRSPENQAFSNVARGQNFTVPHYESQKFELGKICNLGKNHSFQLKK